MVMPKVQVGAILAVAMTAIVVSVLAASVMWSANINSDGHIRGIKIGVYSDSGCTKNVTYINWGILDAGSNVTFTVYIKDEGTLPVRLSMMTGNWTPTSASNYMTLKWNREDYVLDAGSVVQSALTLSVSSDINGITNFSFDILVVGTEIQ